ncbi:MAG TPA: hypothetical protein VMY35_15080, partial [Phycisphaerae bacterium]|nr:hypothetical protein [Phycisphaerae bacterium]
RLQMAQDIGGVMPFGGGGRNEDFSPVVGANPWQPRLWRGAGPAPLPAQRDQYGGQITQEDARNNAMAAAMLGQPRSNRFYNAQTQYQSELDSVRDSVGQGPGFVPGLEDRPGVAEEIARRRMISDYGNQPPGTTMIGRAGTEPTAEGKDRQMQRQRRRRSGLLPMEQRRGMVMAHAMGRRIPPVQNLFEQNLMGGRENSPEMQAANLGPVNPHQQSVNAGANRLMGIYGMDTSTPQGAMSQQQELQRFYSGNGTAPKTNSPSGVRQQIDPLDQPAFDAALEAENWAAAREIAERNGVQPGAMPRHWQPRTWTEWADRQAPNISHGAGWLGERFWRQFTPPLAQSR